MKILYANLTLQDRTGRKPKTYTLEKQVYTHRKGNILKYSNLKDRRIINRLKVKNDLHVVKVDVIREVGEVNKLNK